MKESKIYLEHILESIHQIKEYTKDITQRDFFSSRLLQDAVIRNFEIIGEASKKIDNSIKVKYSHIEWRKISGMRDKLIHDYMGVDLWAVWNVIVDIIPEFEINVNAILINEFDNG